MDIRKLTPILFWYCNLNTSLKHEIFWMWSIQMHFSIEFRYFFSGWEFCISWVEEWYNMEFQIFNRYQVQNLKSSERKDHYDTSKEREEEANVILCQILNYFLLYLTWNCSDHWIKQQITSYSSNVANDVRIFINTQILMQ